MQIDRAYRFRLAPTEAQAVLMKKTAGCRRYVYNLALEQRSLLYRERGYSIGLAEQDRQLTELKKELEWLREVPAQALQQGLRDLNTAFERFFAGLSGYPDFRSKYEHDSFRLPQPKPEHVREDAVFLSKIGWVRIRQGEAQHRVQGRIRSLTVKLENGAWYLSVNCEVTIADPVPVMGYPVGMDRGVAITAALSDGRSFHTPQFTPGEATRYERLARQLSRQQKGSKNREKTKTKMAAMRARLSHRRLDAIHRFTTDLAQNHGVIVLESLKVASMTRSARGTTEAPGRNVRQKAGLNRVILQQLWGEIRRQLLYKTGWYGSELRFVPPQYTSRTCSACDYQHEESRVSQAEFCCVRCGLVIHADLNAALVILALGLGVNACAGTAEADAVRQEGVVQASHASGVAACTGRPEALDVTSENPFRL
jgi:putative transposase